MKLGPVTKLDKRNMATSKKPDDSIMSVNCDVNVFFLIYNQFSVITYICINSDILSYKILKKEVKNLYHSLYAIALSKGTTFFFKKKGWGGGGEWGSWS